MKFIKVKQKSSQKQHSHISLARTNEIFELTSLLVLLFSAMIPLIIYFFNAFYF